MKLVNACLAVVFAYLVLVCLACLHDEVPIERPCMCLPAPAVKALEPETVAAETVTAPIEGPLKITVSSVQFVPTATPFSPRFQWMVAKETDVFTSNPAISALAPPMPAQPVWQQEFQNSVGYAGMTFLVAEMLHREYERLFVSDQALNGLKLWDAWAMHLRITMPDYPLGFLYSESFCRTIADERTKFLWLVY